MKVRLSTIGMIIYLATGVLFMGLVGMSALDGEVDLQFYADTLTYERIARDEVPGFDPAELVTISGNYLGPVLLLQAFDANRWAIMAVNMAAFAFAVWLLRTATLSSGATLVLLLALSPMTFSSLLSVNKEIIALVAMAFLVKHLYSKQVLPLAPAFLFAFLARWQLAVCVLVVALASMRLNPLRKHPLLMLVAFVFALSVVYPPLLPVFLAVDEQAASGLDAVDSERSGVYRLMLEIQNAGGYWLVVIPKALQAMFGPLARPDSFFDPENFYNSVIVTLHAAVMLAVLVMLIVRRAFRLGEPAIAASLFLIVFFALTPVFAPRYFYPVFVLWVVALARCMAQSDSMSVLYRGIRAGDAGPRR